MLGDLRQGTTWMGTLTNMTGRLADKLLQTASDRTISAFFDAFTKGGAANSNGFLGTIASVIGGGKFDVGGYTGPGDRYDVAGFVHRGEVVYSQDDVARHGGVAVVEAIRRGGLRGYADGGVVGRGTFTMPSRAMMAPSNDAIPGIAFINTGTPQEQKAPARWGTDETRPSPHRDDDRRHLRGRRRHSSGSRGAGAERAEDPALIVWPAELPQRVLASGYSESLGDGRLRTQMETGPMKVRRRFSAVARPIAASFRVSPDGKARIERFWWEEIGAAACRS